mgnify:CR=1 FL=1
MNNGRKETFASPHLIPATAICDPDLTLGLPPLLTAATGMDALTHAVESFIATSPTSERQRQIAAMPLPTPRRVSPSKADKLAEAKKAALAMKKHDAHQKET